MRIYLWNPYLKDSHVCRLFSLCARQLCIYLWPPINGSHFVLRDPNKCMVLLVVIIESYTNTNKVQRKNKQGTKEEQTRYKGTTNKVQRNNKQGRRSTLKTSQVENPMMGELHYLFLFHFYFIFYFINYYSLNLYLLDVNKSNKIKYMGFNISIVYLLYIY